MKVKFADKHPVLGLLLYTFGAFVVSEYVIGIIMILALSSVAKDASTTTALGGCIGAILVLVFWYVRFSSEYRFVPRQGEISGAFKLITVPMLIYWILLFGCYAFIAKGIPFGAPTIKAFFMALMAGLVEEICFREIAVSFMARI